MRIYFDTETTGFPNKSLPPNHPDQSAICSLAWAVVSSDWRIIDEQHHLIRPEGWTLTPEQSAFHGITHEKCMEEGKEFRWVRNFFSGDISWGRVTQVCAFNIEFDKTMLWNHCARHNLPPIAIDTPLCVMELASAFCQLPPTEKMRKAGFGNKFKAPKLSEALRIICGREHEGAHDALADVRATIAVHKRLEELANDS